VSSEPTSIPGAVLLACLLTFHSPDGGELLIGSDAIKAIKPAEPQHHRHLAEGTNTVVYIGVRSTGFAVRETLEETMQLIRDCERKPPK
jgi:hypothetical protein